LFVFYLPYTAIKNPSRLVIMPGETSLQSLLATLRVTLHPTVYVFATIPHDREPLPVPLSEVLMLFREEAGITIIVPLEQAQKYDLQYFYECKRITLDVHSSLEAVGFMAVVASRLAEAALSSNPVSAYYHDHLFVKQEEAEKAVELLQNLATTPRAPAELTATS
jgi:uncharacterized protein